MKNVMIFGDSYSTFAGYIPQGYAAYYSENEKEETDVRHVEETWWYGLCKELSLNLVQNNSWSGSTLGNTGYNGDCSKTSSFICRMDKLAAEDFYAKNDIDTVFIFGCTNDSWANAPLGEVKFTEHTADDLLQVCPAIAYFVHKLKTILPDGNIIFIINTNLKTKIKEAIKTVCEHEKVSYVALSQIDKNCGHPTIKGMAHAETGR